MSLSQFYRSVRHIPPKQLWLRLWLTARRRVTMSPLGRSLRVRRNQPLPHASELPLPVFPPRSHLVREHDGSVFLHQLNQTYPLNGDIDWDLANEEQPTHLERLAFHYLEFIETLDAEVAEPIVLDWIQRTPPWQPGYWLDTWNSYAVSIRTVCMMQWLATNQRLLSESTFATVAASVAEQVRFLFKNLELDIRGNHLMKNIKCLLWAGRFFESRESDSWFRRGRDLLNEELKAQFLHDGVHFELSPAYHCQVFADVLECASVAGDEQSAVVSKMESAAQAIADLTHPDLRISLFNDAGLNMAYLPDSCLHVFEKLGGKRPEARDRFGFSDSGFYGGRFDRTYLVFDCGPSCADQLPAHGHGDILAFEWDVDGHRVIVDAGVKEYETGASRQWNRSTKAHNTVTVGSRDQCEFLKSFRVGQRAHGQLEQVNFDSNALKITGQYSSNHTDGQSVQHSRQVTANDISVEVVDDVSSRHPEEAVARLLLHHDCEVETIDANSVRLRSHSTWIRVDSDSPINVCSAVWSSDFGTEFPTQQLEFRYGPTPCQGRFTLVLED